MRCVFIIQPIELVLPNMTRHCL